MATDNWPYSFAYPSPPPQPEPTAQDFLRKARQDANFDLAQAHALIAIGMLLDRIEQHLAHWSHDPSRQP